VDALRLHWKAVFAEKALGRSAASRILPFARVAAPPSCAWTLSFEDISSSVEKMADSAPGPDGVPSSAWLCRSPPEAAPLPGLRLLYKAYLLLLCGRPPPRDFNYANIVFLPKVSLLRMPFKYRGCPRTAVLSTCPTRTTRSSPGLSTSRFIKWLLHMGILLRGALREADFHWTGLFLWRLLPFGSLMLRSPTACLLALDSKAAFASVIREWLWLVLGAMGIPQFAITALELLHRDCLVNLIFGGKVWRGFFMRSGIKQGCPSGPRLFLLALDPFLWCLASRLPPQVGTFAVIADNVALALRSLVVGLRTTLDASAILGFASGIVLNVGKCEVAPCLGARLFFAPPPSS